MKFHKLRGYIKILHSVSENLHVFSGVSLYTSVSRIYFLCKKFVCNMADLRGRNMRVMLQFRGL